MADTDTATTDEAPDVEADPTPDDVICPLCGGNLNQRHDDALRVPAGYDDESIAYMNQLRAQHGLEPIHPTVIIQRMAAVEAGEPPSSFPLT